MIKDCGDIKEGFNGEIMTEIFKHILKLQSNMIVNMSREENIASCIPCMQSAISSLDLKMEEIMPKIRLEIEAIYETLVTQFKTY